MPPKAKRWCFTLNNYTTGEYDLLCQTLESEHVSYGIVGKETGEQGTPHLQGYCIFEQEKRLAQAKSLLGPRVHLEVSRGTPTQASEYCKKEGDFNEYGTLPDSPNGGGNSKAGKWEQLVKYVQDINDSGGDAPSEADLYTRFPGLMGPQRRGVLALVASLHRPTPREVGQPHVGWQQDLIEQLNVEPDDRTIRFIVDPQGNNGKSWICRYLLNMKPDDAQYLRIGKRDDLAHAIDPRRSIFLFDIPRRSMEYLQYNVLESLKDGQVFSPKYESGTKKIKPCHVIVFSNEEPDFSMLTLDRYQVTRISEITLNV